MNENCLECGARLESGRTCLNAFHQMLYWENEDPARGEVHHLMVLCYHLQHPSLYSTEGLTLARELLADFIVGGLNPTETRRRNRQRVASGSRAWTITAREGNRGNYGRPIEWTMTAADVVAAGPGAYREQVIAWARATHWNLIHQA